MLPILLHLISIVIHTLYFIGKWYRNFFTHADVIELLEAMQGMTIASSRDIFFSIVTSVCPTSLSRYKLFKKAQTVQSQTVTRKSSRRAKANTLHNNNNTSNIDPPRSKLFRVSALKKRNPLRCISKGTGEGLNVLQPQQNATTPAYHHGEDFYKQQHYS